MADADSFHWQDLSLAFISLTNINDRLCTPTEEMIITGDDTDSPIGEMADPIALALNNIVSRKIVQDLVKEKPHFVTSRRKSVKFSFASEADHYGFDSVAQEQTSIRKSDKFSFASEARRNSPSTIIG